MNNVIRNSLNTIKEIEKQYRNNQVPRIEVGDTIKIKKIIQEGNKERAQVSEGVVISKKNSGLNKTITVRKIIHSVGVEKIYLIHSPKITDIEIMRRSKVKKSKLYYLRSRSGKATRLKQKFN